MRVTRWLSTLILLLISGFNAISQCTGDPDNPGVPIDEDDPPCQVPLDTWVYVLVIAAVIFGAYHLYKKQKAFSA